MSEELQAAELNQHSPGVHIQRPWWNPDVKLLEAATLGGWCQDLSPCSAESSGFPRKQPQLMAVPETTLNWLYSVLTSVGASWLLL